MQKATAAPSPTTPALEFRPAYAWYFVIVLTACYTLSYIDRQILTLLVGPIKKDLGASDTMIGFLQGAAFSLFYTFVGLAMGRFADRGNRRNLIGASILVWSFFSGACSIARSYGLLFLTRMGVGVGEAGLSPAAYSMIADVFPKEKLGVALSVFYMGVFLGSSLALILGGATVEAVSHLANFTLPFIGSMAPWRLTFLIAAVPGVPFALLIYTLREPLRRGVLSSKSSASRLDPAQTFDVIRRRWASLLGIAVGMAFQATCNYAFMAWAPTFFARTHHWKPAETGRALGFVIAIFGCLGMYAGGKLSDYWLKKGIREAPLRVAIPSAMGTLLLFPPAFLTTNATLTLALFCPGIFFLALPMGSAAAALQMIFPNEVRGQVSAFYLFCLNLGGLTLGPLLPGVLDDYVFHSEAALGKSAAITIAGGAILMLIVFAASHAPYRRHYDLLHSPSV